MNKLAKVAQLITTDFIAFCQICLTLPAKDFKVSPEKTTIKTVPFNLAQHQVEFFKYLQKPMTDYTVLKCRQRGYTTELCAQALWLMLYSRNQNILFTTKEEADAKEYRRLIEEMYYSIPKDFLPKGIAIYRDGNIYNHNRNNHLILKTATDKTGRSGTYTLSIHDEFSWYEKAVQEQLVAAIVSSSQKRIWVSTPKQENDEYHRMVLKAEKEGTLWKHTYWEYTEDWFGSEENAKLWRISDEKNRSAAQIARELDCKFKGAAEDLVWFIPPEAYVVNKNSPNSRVIASLDVGWEDPTAILFAYDYGNRLYIADELVTNHTTIPDLVKEMKALYKNYKYGIIDSSALKVDQTVGFSIHNDISRRLGCRFYTGKPRKEEGLQIAQTAILDGRVFIDANRCPLLIEMFNNYEFEGETLPHNKYSHLHDSLVYLVYNWLKKNSKKITPPRLLNRRSVGIL